MFAERGSYPYGLESAAGNSSDSAGPPREISPNKEIVFHINGIVICGLPGTGKTRLSEALGRELGVPGRRRFKVGNILRSQMKVETGESMVDFYERPLSVDEQLDQKQLDLFVGRDSQGPFILESKKGGFLAKRFRKQCLKAGVIPPPFVTIHLTGDKETLSERVYRREHKKNHALTREESDAKTENRRARDLEQWIKQEQEHDPELKAIDLEDSDLYDISIDTTSLSVQEVKDRVMEELLTRGHIEINPKQPLQPSSGDLFSVA